MVQYPLKKYTINKKSHQCTEIVPYTDGILVLLIVVAFLFVILSVANYRIN